MYHLKLSKGLRLKFAVNFMRNVPELDLKAHFRAKFRAVIIRCEEKTSYCSKYECTTTSPRVKASYKPPTRIVSPWKGVN